MRLISVFDAHVFPLSSTDSCFSFSLLFPWFFLLFVILGSFFLVLPLSIFFYLSFDPSSIPPPRRRSGKMQLRHSPNLHREGNRECATRRHERGSSRQIQGAFLHSTQAFLGYLSGMDFEIGSLVIAVTCV